MDEQQLHALAKDFLEPLIPGAILEDQSIPAAKKDRLVALADPCTIHFRANRNDPYRLVLRRSQPFKSIQSGVVTESQVVGAFVSVVDSMKAGLRSSYHADLRGAFPRRVVARALCSASQDEEAVLDAMDQLAAWAGQQYEGKAISAAIGFVPGAQQGPVKFREFCKNKFSTVLSNGFDTILTCNFRGEVLGHEALGAVATVPSFAPYRLGAIADWARDGRIALVLNRARDILVFRGKQLRFCRRGGRWHFLTHTPVLTQMGRPANKEIRKAVYTTCLDASFAQTGACIGIVTSSNWNRWKEVAIFPNDHLRPAESHKAKAIAQFINGRSFQDLDRRLRQELVAIDGATLIDHYGTILAVGAILKIPGGSADGARLAAAKALSTLGVGIKVSQDGGISGFHDGKDEAKFIVM